MVIPRGKLPGGLSVRIETDRCGRERTVRPSHGYAGRGRSWPDPGGELGDGLIDGWGG